MDKISVKVLRDVANNPSIVEIIKNNRKIKATFEPETGLVLEGPGGLLPSVAEILQMAYPFEMPSSARPAWYDRNPKVRVATYSAAGVAPHGVTQRISYNCPVDRIALIEMLNGWVARKTAATTAGVAGIWWSLQPSGEAEGGLFNSVNFVSNDVGVGGIGALGVTVTLFSGDVIRGSTRDTSTLGTCDYSMTHKITEFDA